MTTTEILKFLQKDIHSTIFATTDSQGLPWACVIDLMLADEDGLYFLTAKGKSFYERLTTRPFVALSSKKGGYPDLCGRLPERACAQHRSGTAG